MLPRRSSTHERVLRFSCEKLCLLSASPLPQKILRLFWGALVCGALVRPEKRSDEVPTEFIKNRQMNCHIEPIREN